MKRYLLILSIIVSAFHSEPEAQVIRTAAMGGLTYSITDEDFSLTPFDLGGNPAWLINDEKQSWLKISPSFANQSGDYRRVYDPSEYNLYNVLFRGVKTLGADGTFMGETTYEYDQRKNVYRTLKYNSYRGEAFFMNDTTTGSFRYNGPSMKFTYSFEPLEKFFAGASAGYKILDGLKNTYSRSQTLYRVVTGHIGLAYVFNENFIAGLTGGITDEQEKIEAKSEDLLEVEIFNFKGETFSVRKRSGTVTQKIRTQEKNAGLQVYLKPFSQSEIGLAAEVSSSKERILMPRSFTSESYAEFEDGYANFTNYNFVFTGKYFLTSEILFGIHADYCQDKSWSKNSYLDLLLWKWDLSNISVGLGSSFKITDDLLIGIEYEYSMMEVDSSKYADSRNTNFSSNNHLIRLGAEYRAAEDFYFRGGYNLGLVEKDIYFGGTDVNFNRVSFGAGLILFESVELEGLVEYSKLKPGDNNDTRSFLRGNVTLKLYSF